MAEEQIRESGLKWTILRPTMIYGAPGDRNLSRLLTLLPRVPVLPVPGGGRHLQQPVHVADVADAVLSAVERPESAGTTYDIAGPEPLSFAELLRVAARAVGSRTRFVPVPLSPLVAAARGYELLAARPRIRAEQLQRLAEDKAFSIKDAARDLGYAPRSFAEGIVAEARALGTGPGALHVTNGNLALLARTAAHLQPSQVTRRARLRAQRTALRRFPPARHWLMAGPDPAARGRLARPVQPARRAALAELARIPAAARGAHRPARHDQDTGHAGEPG